jgi:integral membrane protein
MLKTAIGRLRVIGLAEGVSYLVLLGIAMPLKYAAKMPMPVKIVGWIHGLLFILFIAALVHAAVSARWKLIRVATAFIASLLPFGTFVLDKSLQREEREGRGALAPN